MSNSKKTLVHTIRSDYTTDDDLSITERCDKSIQHSSLVWQTGAIVDTATHSTRSSLVVSQTNRLTRQYERTSAPSPYSKTWCPQTTPQGDQKNILRLVTSPLFVSTLFASLRRTNNNKHNDTVNLHAQNCCTHKLQESNSSKNLPKCVQIKASSSSKWCVRITHRIHYNYCWSTHGGTITQPINTIGLWAKSYAHDDSAIISHLHWQ